MLRGFTMIPMIGQEKYSVKASQPQDCEVRAELAREKRIPREDRRPETHASLLRFFFLSFFPSFGFFFSTTCCSDQVSRCKPQLIKIGLVPDRRRSCPPSSFPSFPSYALCRLFPSFVFWGVTRPVRLPDRPPSPRSSASSSSPSLGIRAPVQTRRQFPHQHRNRLLMLMLRELCALRRRSWTGVRQSE